MVSLWGAVAWAQPRPRWQLGPELELGPLRVALTDGRLLTCFGREVGARCELVDPLTAEHHAVAVENPADLVYAVALDDGQLLLRSRHLLLDPETGATRPIPPLGRELAALIPHRLPGGRAVFELYPASHRLLFFLGASQGFRELDVGPAETPVEWVRELGDGVLLVARSLPPAGAAHDVELLLLSLRDWTWQRGARVRSRALVAAFRNGDDIVLLTDDGGTRALILDRRARMPRFELLTPTLLQRGAHRLSDGQLLLFDGHGGLLWNPSSRSLTPILWPVPPPQVPLVIERGGQLAVIDPGSRRALVLSRDPPPRQTPCDDPFTYTRAVMASGGLASFDGGHFRALLAAPVGATCADCLEREGTLPDELTAPLEALARRGGLANHEEEAAAEALCTLAPSFSGPLLARLNRPPTILRAGLSDLCRDAGEKVPVLAAARARRDVSAALVRAGLQTGAGGAAIPPWTAPLLASRRDLARSASSLLLAAHEQRARGFDGLRSALCGAPEPELTEACAQTGGLVERDWQRASGHARLVRNFAITTGVIGAAGGLAYVGRRDDLGRGLAIGTGIAGGAALAVALTIASSRGSGGDVRGLSTLLLAVPMAVLGAVGGGLLGAKLSEDRGDPRFATAAVPLSAAWLTGAIITIEAW